MSASPEILAYLAANPCDGTDCRAGMEFLCYPGEWTVHPPHHYVIHFQRWNGGGTKIVHCPGKTEATKL